MSFSRILKKSETLTEVKWRIIRNTSVEEIDVTDANMDKETDSYTSKERSLSSIDAADAFMDKRKDGNMKKESDSNMSKKVRVT